MQPYATAMNSVNGANENMKCATFNVHRRGQPNDRMITEAIAKRRSRSNRKERKRNEEMNHAYEQLQKCVPHIPSDQKLPKIKTLRLALRYIEHLQNVLSGNETFLPSFSNEARPLELEDFASVAMAEVQARNNYKDRAERETMHGIPLEQVCRRNIEQQYTVPPSACYQTFSPPNNYCNPSPPDNYHNTSPPDNYRKPLPSPSDLLPGVFMNSTNFNYSPGMQPSNTVTHYQY